jgi:hypothetical protein
VTGWATPDRVEIDEYFERVYEKSIPIGDAGGLLS